MVLMQIEGSSQQYWLLIPNGKCAWLFTLTKEINYLILMSSSWVNRYCCFDTQEMFGRIMIQIAVFVCVDVIAS
jgi:hypothetical protein